MADAGRQSFTDKAESKLKPDSSKTTTEKIGDTFKGTGDKAAREVQPQGTKSNTQGVADSLGHSKDEHKNQGGSVVDKVKDTLGMNNR